jgi:hypothetical protein
MFAFALEMDITDVLWIIKWPQVFWNAWLNPGLGISDEKYAMKSEPW